MQYICPKCGWFMNSISMAVIPPTMYYKCLSCGYTSKKLSENPSFIKLPKELWSDKDDEDEFKK